MSACNMYVIKNMSICCMHVRKRPMNIWVYVYILKVKEKKSKRKIKSETVQF